MNFAIKELVTYLNDLAAYNQDASTQIINAVNGQFKEVRAIKTVVNLKLDEEIDEERIRASYDQVALAMERTESKKFGDSTQVLSF